MYQIYISMALLAMAIISFSSCEKEAAYDNEYASGETLFSIDPDSTVTDYPQAIDEYVAANYPNDSIHEVEINELGEYEVELSDPNETELLFDSEGNFIKILEDDGNDSSSEDDQDYDGDENEDEDHENDGDDYSDDDDDDSDDHSDDDDHDDEDDD